MVVVVEEISTRAKVDFEKIIRQACKDVGFTSKVVGSNEGTCKVRVSITLASKTIV